DEPTGALNRSASDEVMSILNSLNDDGTTMMIVTHDMKVAAKCSKVMYIVDGNIKGELELGKLSASEKGTVKDMKTIVKEREKKINNWLSDMGW
ncbi:MAG: ABC transporter ATP-binding protein, partial [Lachnospiraceae bacterium]|nr:ABC transporter ATP-binding protein [Lachnospiraceae bacterium]